jgi:hypothetical protein
MDYKELMCGDWVKVEQTTEIVNAIVLGVYKDGINYEVNYSGVRATNQIHTDYVSPIPLTEEILVKNGFGKVNNQYFFGQVEVKELRDCWVVTINKKDADIDINIHYVHQLQHLLWLCGIDKEIEL